MSAARPLLLVVTLLGAASAGGCLQPIDAALEDGGTRPDGGAGPESAGGGDAGGAGPDAGSDGGYLPPSDAGMETDGGSTPGPITWAQMTIPSSSAVRAVAALSRTLAYATGAVGNVLRYDGNAWTEVARNGSNLTMTSLYLAPDGAVFVAGGGQMGSCKQDCHLSTSYVWRSLSANIQGVCGQDANTVYATGTGGTSSNAGRLYQFDPSTSNWTLLVSDTGSFFNTRCWVAPSGDVFIAAQAEIIRYAGGLTFEEQINFPSTWNTSTIALQMFEDVGGSGDHVYAVGYRRGIIARNASGTWDYVMPADGIDDYHAIAAAGPADILVGGQRSGDNRFLRHFDGQSWTTPQNVPSGDIWGLAAVDGKTWFASGYSSGTVGAIWIGLRP